MKIKKTKLQDVVFLKKKETKVNYFGLGEYGGTIVIVIIIMAVIFLFRIM